MNYSQCFDKEKKPPCLVVPKTKKGKLCKINDVTYSHLCCQQQSHMVQLSRIDKVHLVEQVC